jgi:hypothetical protein
MPVASKIDNVCEPEGLELFHMAPCCDGTTKRQPPIYEVRLHRSHAPFQPRPT